MTDELTALKEEYHRLKCCINSSTHLFFQLLNDKEELEKENDKLVDLNTQFALDICDLLRKIRELREGKNGNS